VVVPLPLYTNPRYCAQKTSTPLACCDPGRPPRLTNCHTPAPAAVPPPRRPPPLQSPPPPRRYPEGASPAGPGEDVRAARPHPRRTEGDHAGPAPVGPRPPSPPLEARRSPGQVEGDHPEPARGGTDRAAALEADAR